MFNSEIWREPLEKFSAATGMTVSLFDRNGHRHCGPFPSTPIAQHLNDFGFWAEDGVGTLTDRQSALDCVRTGKSAYSVELEVLAHFAAPLEASGRIIGAFTLGWVPYRFADPVACDLMAKKLGLNAMELWQLVRMQQPVPREKIQVYASMLEIFSLPIVRQMEIQLDERDQSRISRIISETALLFAEAKTEREICSAAMDAIRKIVPALQVVIKIPVLQNESETISIYDRDWTGTDTSEGNGRAQNWLNIPIPGPEQTQMGSIEATTEGEELNSRRRDDLAALAGQLGVALQKVRLIGALESERSSLKGANSELNHLHKMKDEFLATVSHELRTPLNAILGWSEVLKEDDLGPAQVKGAIATIERNAKSQARLIEDLLDVSRIISGKMALQREDVEAVELVKKALETVQPMIEARKQKLHAQLPPGPIMLKGDSERLTQVFWNLLSNASKFTPEGGTITVVLETVGHYFKFEVSDTGKGIPAKFLPHLFTRFSQADGSHTRRHGGLGLGLAIVRHLVELHGGTISAKSEGEQRGSTFTALFPQNTTDRELDTAHLLQPNSSQSPQVKLPSLEGISVLLVDDEPDALRLCRFILERCGAKVEIADGADQAFRILRDSAPDIIISDISMPGESGYDLIRRVRNLKACHGGQTPAIALTALAGSETKSQILSAGYQLHLTKPVEPVVLIENIISVLNLDQSLRAPVQ